MREFTDRERLYRLLDTLGRAARRPARLYLVGGATAVDHGWRPTTADVDLVFEPDSGSLYAAIAEAKERLDIYVEIASPAHFLPELAGWRDHSLHVGQFGKLTAAHYDPRAQVLAKIERDHAQDRLDVASFLRTGLTSVDAVWAAFEEMRPELVRFPAIDPPSFDARVRAVCGR
jgi:hypothetical protein